MSVLSLLVAIETIVLALLTLVVVGLLRSHAEILRRLPEDRPSGSSSARGETAVGAGSANHDRAVIPEYLPEPRPAQTGVFDIAGTTLDGAQIVLSPARSDTLIAFLSSGCLSCRSFWEGLRPAERVSLPGDPRLVVVVKDLDMESPSRLHELAPEDLPVVMSSKAWSDYEVPMAPYFLFVSAATGTVRSEGAAGSWEQVGSLLRDSVEDERALAEGSGAR